MPPRQPDASGRERNAPVQPPEKGTDLSVESTCNALVHSGLLAKEDVRALHLRWREVGREEADSVEAFTRWLASQGRLTEHQAAVVARGNANQLILGPYRVLERIGKGRFAGVYRALHPTGQIVAIKVLPPSKAKDPQILARFRREAQLALPLNHPNVVRTFHTGLEKGLHFLVMECLEGETFAEMLRRRGKLPPAEAVRLIHQALEGLQHLHEQGLVHRDLGPANLMLVDGEGPANRKANVKIVDIGTGRALFEEEEGKEEFELTNERDVLGTAEYMAPEQAHDPHGADIRADVYSLGCTFYHALAGQPPFAEKNRVRVLVRHATEQPRPVREHSPEVPEGLQQIVDWMLAKEPGKRYPTPRRAAQALQVFLAAGADAGPREENPETRAYLTWLASAPTRGGAGGKPPDPPCSAPPLPGPDPSLPKRKPPPARVLDAPAPPPAGKPGGTRKMAAPQKAVPPPVTRKPPAPPALPPSRPPPIETDAVDVELVPLDGNDGPDPATSRLPPVLLLLALGLGLGLVSAVAVGLVVYFFVL